MMFLRKLCFKFVKDEFLFPFRNLVISSSMIRWSVSVSVLKMLFINP